MQLSVSAVPPEQLDFVWAQVSPMVRRGLKHGAGDTVSEAEIYTAIAGQSMLLWAVHEDENVTAIIVLQIVERERGLALIVVLVAGRAFHTWCDNVQQLITDYAELIGAYTIEAVARDGMAKWLEGMGWRKKATVMELRHGR